MRRTTTAPRAKSRFLHQYLDLVLGENTIQVIDAPGPYAYDGAFGITAAMLISLSEQSVRQYNGGMFVRKMYEYLSRKTHGVGKTS